MLVGSEPEMLDQTKRALKMRPRSALRAFLNGEAAGGLVLMGVALLALAVANSPLAPGYFAILETYVLGLSILH